MALLDGWAFLVTVGVRVATMNVETPREHAMFYAAAKTKESAHE